jgi:hypothetical protein
MLQQIDQQQAEKAAQANQQAPAPDLVGAEKVKGEVKMKVEGAKMQQEGQIKSAEIQQKGQLESQQLQMKTESEMLREMMLDDRERDKQDADFAVQSKKVELDDATAREVGLKQAAARPGPGTNGSKPRSVQ